MTTEEALRLIPQDAPHRDKLAALLCEIKSAPIAKQAEVLRRHEAHLADFQRARDLLDACPKFTEAYGIVYAAARRRFETARKFARKYGFAPVRWGRSPR